MQFAVYAVDGDVKTWARVVGTTPSARWLDETIGDVLSIEITNSRNALNLALAGMARVVPPTSVENVHKGLQQVAAPIEVLVHDQQLVTHDEDRSLPEVRRVIERVYTVLRAALN